MITETTVTDEDDDSAGDTAGLHLLVISPDVFAAQPLPTPGAVKIGRSSRCAVQLEDPMVSREHVRLHVAEVSGVPLVTVEDAGSANGTRLRDGELAPGDSRTLKPGEEIWLGSTVLMVLPNRGPRRLRSHAYFEARVANECAQAAKGGAPFALARLRFARDVAWNKVLPILALGLPATGVFAAYGPGDYEILLVDVNEVAVDATMRSLIEASEAAELAVRGSVAWFPKDGKTSDTLLAAASSLLRVKKAGAPERTDRDAASLAPMQRVRDMATRVASSPINVLVVGECGVGKDVLAQLIHKLSPRAAKPFVALNCAGLTPTLLESELFGHEKGAFTGAIAPKTGLLEAANGGTVFLDEVGDMPALMQASLLRVLEAREVRPIGAVKNRPIDVRFISATNKDIDAAVAKGDFREDLKFRLDVMRLRVPPLRERTDEIPALAATFVAAACHDVGRKGPPIAISDEVMDLLVSYGWPGNIRELKNVMERAVALCEGPELTPEHLPLERMGSPMDPFATQKVSKQAPLNQPDVRVNLPPLADAAKSAERQRVVDALVAENWNQTRAALRLGMSRASFVAKLDEFEIPRPQKGRTLAGPVD